MEPTLWTKFILFVKESYLYRVKESFAGIIMGFGISKRLLFSGHFALLVSLGWWLVKVFGSLSLTFISSLLTSYASILVKRWTEPKERSPDKERKNKKAA